MVLAAGMVAASCPSMVWSQLPIHGRVALVVATDSQMLSKRVQIFLVLPFQFHTTFHTACKKIQNPAVEFIVEM